jgi:thioredoxin 1
MATAKVTTADFDSVVLKSPTPVLVDFWAEWCGPCRTVGPILEEISNEYGDKLKIVKLNTDEEGSIAMRYNISSIPTMSVFVGGQVVKTIVGAKPKPALLKDLESYLK